MPGNKPVKVPAKIPRKNARAKKKISTIIINKFINLNILS